MPKLDGDFGTIDGHPIRVLDTPEYTSTRFMAWAEGMKDGLGAPFGPTPEIAVQRLKDRARDGRTDGDPVRRALLPDGDEALSTSRSLNSC